MMLQVEKSEFNVCFYLTFVGVLGVEHEIFYYFMLLSEFMPALKTISEINFLFLQWTFLLRVEYDDNQSAPETKTTTAKGCFFLYS